MGTDPSPWRASSPLTAATQTVLALQNIVSQRVDALDGPTVMTVRLLQSETKANILPDAAEIAGTARSLLAKNRRVAAAQIKRIAEGAPAARVCKLKLMCGPVTRPW